MGAMHTWMWGTMYPDVMDALMPLASAPVEIGGRNRMLRKMIMDSIKRDPNWNDGEYKGPLNMVAANFALFLIVLIAAWVPFIVRTVMIYVSSTSTALARYAPHVLDLSDEGDADVVDLRLDGDAQ